MNDADKLKLEQKKQALQRKIKAADWLKSNVDEALEILNEFDSKKLNYQITGLKLNNPELEPQIRNQLAPTQYTQWKFNKAAFNPPQILQKIETLFRKFPTTNPLRYVPALPEFFPENSENALNEITSQFNLSNQNLHLYYLKYAPLIQIPLSELQKADLSEIINLWHGDTLIFPEDLAWLIIHTLEENWFFVEITG